MYGRESSIEDATYEAEVIRRRALRALHRHQFPDATRLFIRTRKAERRAVHILLWAVR